MSHQKPKFLLRLGSLACATWMLAACTSGDDQVRTEDVTSPAPTSTITSTSTVIQTPTSETSAATTADSSHSASTSSSISQQWPSTFTDAQIQDAQAGLVAVTGLNQVTEEASAAPASKDWTADVYKYAGGAAAMQTLASIKSLADANVHATSPQLYEDLNVLAADEHRMVIEACIDASGLVLVDANGKSVLTPPVDPRVIETYTLYVPEGGGWLVGEMAAAEPVRPC